MDKSLDLSEKGDSKLIQQKYRVRNTCIFKLFYANEWENLQISFVDMCPQIEACRQKI